MNPITENYFFRAVHYYIEDEIKERQIFERKLRVTIGKKTEATFYDPNLKMHFHDENKSGFRVEAVMEDFQLGLCKRMKQAEDFLRRTNYRFDRMLLKINGIGKIISIEEIGIMKKNWEKLKLFLQSDYSGYEAEDYLEEIDEVLQTPKLLQKHLFHYFHWGLVFPGIPTAHEAEWQGKRVVGLSEYEGEEWNETIELTGIQNGQRHYRLSGQPLPGSRIEPIKYEGTLVLKQNSLLPLRVQVEVEFRLNAGNNRWVFDLTSENERETEEKIAEAEKPIHSLIL